MVDWNRRARIAESILDTAGMTPMVRLRRVVGDVKPTIVAKIEYCNPSGSVTNANFGKVTSARSPRIAQVALKFLF